MGDEQLVSVIIPTYNYGRFIADTLQSVLSQSYSDIECIVVDDGSTDDTRETVLVYQERDARIIYLPQQKSGVSAARNAGIRRASGSFIQFLDADDLIESRKIEVQKQFLDADPKIDVVYGDACYFETDDSGSKIARERFETVAVSGVGAEMISCLLENNIFVISSPLVRASVVRNLAGFNEGMQHLEDWEFWLRCAIGGSSFSYLYAPGTSTLIRRHGQSLSADSSKMLRANLNLRTELAESLADKGNRRINEKLLTTTRILMAYQTIDAGSHLAGFKELATACLPAMRLKSFLYGMSLIFKGVKARP